MPNFLVKGNNTIRNAEGSIVSSGVVTMDEGTTTTLTFTIDERQDTDFLDVGNSPTYTAVADNGLLTVDSVVQAGNTITVTVTAITAGTTIITGEHDNASSDAAQDTTTITIQAVATGMLGLTGGSLGANGDTIALLLNDTAILNDTSGFSVDGGRVITFVNQSPNGQLNFTLSPALAEGETVNLTYTSVADGIEDAAGNDLPSFSLAFTRFSTSGGSGIPARNPIAKAIVTINGLY